MDDLVQPVFDMILELNFTVNQMCTKTAQRKNFMPTLNYNIHSQSFTLLICLWTGKICLPLNNPENGQVYQFPDGTTAIFSCSNGFTKMGESVLRCVNGNWSSLPPTCIQS